MNLFRISYIVFLFFILPNFCLASKEDVGTTAGVFLKLISGARAMGMGRAYCSIGDDLEACFYNPASISRTLNQEISFLHIEHFEDISYEYIGFRRPVLTNTSLALSISQLNLGEFTRWDKKGVIEGKFKAYDTLINLTYASNITPNLNVGANLKYIHQRLEDYTSKSIALDIGFLGVSDFEDWSYGISIQNLGKKVRFDKMSFKLPLNIKLGISYRYLDGKMISGVDINIPNDQKIFFNLGSEYTLKDIFAFRIGYQSGPYEYKSGISFGFGIRYQDFGLDYAYLPYSEELGNSHLISFSYKFGFLRERIVKEKTAKKYRSYRDYKEERPFYQVKDRKRVLPKLLSKLKKLKKKIEKVEIKKEIPKKEILKEEKIQKTKKEKKITKIFPYDYDYFLKKYPDIEGIKKEKIKEKKKKMLKIKGDFRDFEEYILSDIIKEEKRWIIREDREKGVWKKKKIVRREIPYRERLKEEIDIIPEYPPFKLYKEEPLFRDYWKYYAYDLDTYEYFKKKYGIKEDLETPVLEFKDYEELEKLKKKAKKEKLILPKKEEIKLKRRKEEERLISSEREESMKEQKSKFDEEEIWKKIREEIIKEIIK